MIVSPCLLLDVHFHGNAHSQVLCDLTSWQHTGLLSISFCAIEIEIPEAFPKCL